MGRTWAFRAKAAIATGLLIAFLGVILGGIALWRAHSDTRSAPTASTVAAPTIPHDPFGGPGPVPIVSDLNGNAPTLVAPAFATHTPPKAGESGVFIVRLTREAMARVRSAETADFHSAAIYGQQAIVTEHVTALGGSVLYSLRLSINALVVSLPLDAAASVAALGDVAQVVPAGSMRLNGIPESAQVGVTPASRAFFGVNGTGVHALVLDTGIDYTHVEFGGSGNVTDYRTNNPRIVEPGTFPTAKVVGGYDFIDEDGDPMDEVVMQAIKQFTVVGHGTYFSSILGGVLTGVAPGVSLSMARVCTPDSFVCPAVAMLRAFEYALDPDNTGNISTTIDIVTTPIGDQWPESHPLCDAVAALVDYGIPVVISAGNDGNIPFTVVACANRAEAISVGAQVSTEFGNRYAINISAPASIAGLGSLMAEQFWAPLNDTFHGKVAFVGVTCVRGKFPRAHEPGLVALMLPGECAVNTAVGNAQTEGYASVMIAMPPAPRPDMDLILMPVQLYTMGPALSIPTVFIDFVTAAKMMDALAAGQVVLAGIQRDLVVTNATLQPEIAAYSGRGPSWATHSVHPELTAPGTFLSAALASTGDGYVRYQGTSFSAPVVAGVAVLLLEERPGMSPRELKARLMNTANNNVQQYMPDETFQPCAVTRVGAGMVDFAAASAVQTVLVCATTGQPSLGFGYVSVPTAASVVTRTLPLAVTNLDATAPQTYSVAHSFVFADDAASGTVTLSHPATIVVPAGATVVFNVTMTVAAPAALPAWPFTPLHDPAFHQASSLLMTRGTLMDKVEYDGYVTLAASGGDTVRVPWTVMPRRASNVQTSTGALVLSGANHTGSVTVTNPGALSDSRVVVYALLASGTAMPSSSDPFQAARVPDLQHLGARSYTVDGEEFLEVAVTLYNTLANPVLYGVSYYGSGPVLSVYVRSGKHIVYGFYDMTLAVISHFEQFGASCWTLNPETGAQMATSCLVDLQTNTITFSINMNTMHRKATNPYTIGAVVTSFFSTLAPTNDPVDMLEGVYHTSLIRYKASPFDFYANASTAATVTVVGDPSVTPSLSSQTGLLLYKVHQGTSSAILVS